MRVPATGKLLKTDAAYDAMDEKLENSKKQYRRKKDVDPGATGQFSPQQLIRQAELEEILRESEDATILRASVDEGQLVGVGADLLLAAEEKISRLQGNAVRDLFAGAEAALRGASPSRSPSWKAAKGLTPAGSPRRERGDLRRKDPGEFDNPDERWRIAQEIWTATRGQRSMPLRDYEKAESLVQRLLKGIQLPADRLVLEDFPGVPGDIAPGGRMKVLAKGTRRVAGEGADLVCDDGGGAPAMLMEFRDFASGPVCAHFLEGKCKNGKDCVFRHEQPGVGDRVREPPSFGEGGCG